MLVAQRMHLVHLAVGGRTQRRERHAHVARLRIAGLGHVHEVEREREAAVGIGLVGGSDRIDDARLDAGLAITLARSSGVDHEDVLHHAIRSCGRNPVRYRLCGSIPGRRIPRRGQQRRPERWQPALVQLVEQVAAAATGRNLVDVRTLMQEAAHGAAKARQRHQATGHAVDLADPGFAAPRIAHFMLAPCLEHAAVRQFKFKSVRGQCARIEVATDAGAAQRLRRQLDVRQLAGPREDLLGRGALCMGG